MNLIANQIEIVNNKANMFCLIKMLLKTDLGSLKVGVYAAKLVMGSQITGYRFTIK